ncbi:MAG: hypothetical protein STSR0008_24250 [Ignavibacterium sp.]
MKKLITLFVLSFMVLFYTTVSFAQPTMDGTFDGESIWGTPKEIADGTAGWANVNAKRIFVTNDDTYIYLGAEVTASDWMNWAFIINTKSGGGSNDSWSRNITYTHSNLPDFVIRGNFNAEAWTEINIWNGSAWTGGGTNIGTSEHGDNITGNDANGWVEVRVPRTTITETLGDIQFFITGNENFHGSFDACPNDDNSTDWSGTNAHSDLINYSQNIPLPVELTSFAANILSSGIELNWQTATEVNNYGFDVERSTDKQNWTKLGFVAGNGNSNSPKDYSYVDEDIKNQANGKYYYHLKQIDTDGSYEYSETIEVDWTSGVTDVNDDSNLPKEFSLSQNYPNPFNPTTKIKYTITASPISSPKERTFVRLIVYDVLGNEIAALVNEEKAPGEYEVEFNGKGLSSGMYFYKIEAGNFVQVNKMILMK